MGNSFGGSDDGPRLRLSNGASTVFLDVLALAACELAGSSDFERGFALMLCNARIGLGNESFDLDELPWSSEPAAERAFVVRVVELARSHFRWGMLGYEPPYAESYLSEYAELVRGYSPPRDAVAVTGLWDPSPGVASFAQCPRHGLFVGDYPDCRLCL
ncbi:hypothetical protein [Kribbella sp. NPDC055071]